MWTAPVSPSTGPATPSSPGDDSVYLGPPQVLANPGLAKGTTNTINMGIQMIRPGELAWAHRHSISAIRFVIDGDLVHHG